MPTNPTHEIDRYKWRTDTWVDVPLTIENRAKAGKRRAELLGLGVKRTKAGGHNKESDELADLEHWLKYYARNVHRGWVYGLGARFKRGR